MLLASEIPPVTGSPAGRAQLTVQRVAGQSAITAAQSHSPMKLLTPRARGESVWTYTSSFGGGLVAGDQTQLDLELGAETKCFLGTQASTKVYRNPAAKLCTHTTMARVGAGSLLVFAPDPVQAFAESAYRQTQHFELQVGAGLVLLDWYTAGRTARGERWQFSRLESRNEVVLAGRRILWDAIRLDARSGFQGTAHQTGRYNCFATLFLVGDALALPAAAMLQATAATPVVKQATHLATASSVGGGVLLRLAGVEVETIGRILHQHLRFLGDVLGDDPWQRKW